MFFLLFFVFFVVSMILQQSDHLCITENADYFFFILSAALIKTQRFSLKNPSIILAHKQTAHIRLVWKSKQRLPTYPSLEPLSPSSGPPSSVTCAIRRSITLWTRSAIGWWSVSPPTIMPSDVCFLWRLEAVPPSSPDSNGWFRQDLFSSHPKAEAWVRGQGGVGPGCQGGVGQQG